MHYLAFDWFEAIVEIKVSVLFLSSQTFHNPHPLMDEIVLTIGDLSSCIEMKVENALSLTARTQEAVS